MAEGSASALKRVVRSSFPVAENQHMRINWCSLSLDYDRKPDRKLRAPTFDSTQILPPCISIIRFEIASPRPVPACSRVIEQPFTLEALMQTSPLSVNLWQLPTRLRST